MTVNEHEERTEQVLSPVQEAHIAYCFNCKGRQETQCGSGRAQNEKEDSGIWIISKTNREKVRKDDKEDRSEVQMQGM